MRTKVCIIVFGAMMMGHIGFADVLVNHDFEEGTLNGWDVESYLLNAEASTNTTFNRNYSARLYGSYASDAWTTSSISQTISMNPDDDIDVVGGVFWKTYTEEVADADGFLEVILEGVGGSTQRWDNAHEGWVFFDLKKECLAIADTGFESGELDKWIAGCDDLVPSVQSNVTATGEYALRTEGEWDGWSFNQIYQTITLNSGDVVIISGKVNVQNLQADDGWAVAGIKLELDDSDFEAVIGAPAENTGWVDKQLVAQITNSGIYTYRCMVCGDAPNIEADAYFDDVSLTVLPDVGLIDGGFEMGEDTEEYWQTEETSLIVAPSDEIVSSGNYAMNFNGVLLEPFNLVADEECRQEIGYLYAGDVVEASGKIYIEHLNFQSPADDVLMGFRIEDISGNVLCEDLFNKDYPPLRWLDMGILGTVTQEGTYYLTCFFCATNSSISNLATCSVFYDDINVWRHGEEEQQDSNVTLRVQYSGYSGGYAYASDVDIYFDSVMLEGSTANRSDPTNIFNQLLADARQIATAPDEKDVPDVIYPKLNSYGYCSGDTNVLHFPGHIEAAVSGWRVRYMTNDMMYTVTNVISIGEFVKDDVSWGEAYIEFDQFIYCDKYWHTDRGEELDINTNTPYFTLGDRDNSSAEFGEETYSDTFTFHVGVDPVSSFPRKMSTSSDTNWPSRIEIVFEENFTEFDQSRDKYFVLSTVTTNGEDSNLKAMRFHLNCANTTGTNTLAFETQEIHAGWDDETNSLGMVDYPNCTYQDHNEVALRAGWKYGLLDSGGWFMTAVARGSATIEPIDLYVSKYGNWIPEIYEEYMYMWPNAASGVRSIFDDDYQDRLAGQISYNVGFKIGHVNGTNELGEAQYPQVIEIRGNGYFRMTDYGGVMGGSFRPVSADIFGLYQYMEDAPLIPAAYSRVVPRTSPSDQPDNSYIQTFMPIRSKTNHWFTGAVQMDSFFAPDIANEEGAYFEMDTYVSANKALIRSNDGPLNAFAQVDMYWRGQDKINDGHEGHDFDALVLKKADGEWITHKPLNPPTNIYHRTLSSFREGDSVYIMQQDRGPASYGYNTESPYRRVSSFEITMLEDGDKDMSLDLYEQNTISEINDNCVIACTINEDFEKGEEIHFKYRVRGIYAPGVLIVNPNRPDGGENWSNDTYTIEFLAQDGNDEVVQAQLFYGNGKDDDWTLINSNELIIITTSTNTPVSRYVWDTSGVEPGAYYIKAEAQRTGGGKKGFDISDTRLQVGSTYGFENNGTTNVTVITNSVGYVGENMSFENGDVLGWASGGDTLNIYAATDHAYDGLYAVRMHGSWNGWSWNNLMQEVPCISGEVLQVSASLYVNSFNKVGTLDACFGVKMEDTNSMTAPTEVKIPLPATTGMWMNVILERPVAYSGTQRLILFAYGSDGTSGDMDIYVDNVLVGSTNSGTVVTNQVRNGYWEGDAVVDVSPHDALSFFAEAAVPGADPELWVADDLGVTNSVMLTNYVDQILNIPQRIDVPWSDFSSIDKTRLISFGVESSGAVSASVQAVRSIETPLLMSCRFLNPPSSDNDGLPFYNPGETVQQEITIRNNSGETLSGVNIQVLQEYAENVMWFDRSHGDWWSDKTRKGDRLCGAFENILSNCTIAAGATMVFTNSYTLPHGRMIDHERFAIVSDDDWFIFRNYAARAQVHIVIRESDGDNVYDNDNVAVYSMDDDFDFDDDGLTDDFETLYSGNRTDMDANANSDTDAYSNYAEFIAGTDPLNGFSCPELSTVFIGTDTAQVIFDSKQDRRYWVEACYNLKNPQWERLMSNAVNGTGAQIGIVDEEYSISTNRYYKLRIKLNHDAY